MNAPAAALEQSPIQTLFLDARTHFAWKDRPVDDAVLQQLYDLTRMAPTGANSQPLRLVYAKSPAAKERLRPALAPMNVDKVMAAPATAILAWDTQFHEEMPKLFPGRDFKSLYAAMPASDREHSATMNASLQAGYFILAVRSLGLDAGPIGGFDRKAVDATFFPDGRWRSFLLVNVGYGDAGKLFPRLPRLSFEEAGRIE